MNYDYENFYMSKSTVEGFLDMEFLRTRSAYVQMYIKMFKQVGV